MLSWRRSYLHFRTGRRAGSVAALYSICSEEERRPAKAFFDRYLIGRGTGGLTAVCGIGEGLGPLANGPAIVKTSAGCGDLRISLETELIGEVTDVAVSGGIDSWLLAKLLKSAGKTVRGWYLETGIAGYCEREKVLRMADAVGVDCECFRVSCDDFVEALPRFVSVTETPIYGLHPVSKLLLARALARRGVGAVVSGDGADQVMSWNWDCDLLPLTLTCFQSAGVRLIAPFVSEGVISLCRTPSPDKTPIRDLARLLGVPDVPKLPALFPEIRGLAVADCTTRLLFEYLEGQVPCAASQA